MDGQPTDYRAFRRGMTSLEYESVEKIYRNAQKQARPFGFMALIFAAIGIVNGYGSLDISTSEGMITIMIFLIGLGAFGYSGYMFRLRRKISEVKRSGEVTVVQGRAYMSTVRANAAAVMVGPLTISVGKGTDYGLLEGSTAEIALVPKLGGALVSINGTVPTHPIKVHVPAGLEENASSSPPAYPIPPNAIADKGPDQAANGFSFCHSCGNPTAGLAFCSNCGTKL
ncbi:MAG TPA: hypothetical protein VGK23_09355 [Methanomassiliicoccales archaeon]|jgi:hypothetical protein